MTDRVVTRRAPLRANSFDQDTREFSAVIATSTPVRRRDYEHGEYLEVLSFAPGAVRLGRLKSGKAPLLDSHRAWSIRDQIGTVIGARVENGELIADARLSARDDVKPVAIDLANGTPPNVSIGYRVFKYAESRDADGTKILTATDWEPHEMTLTPVPADPNTHVRSNQGVTMDNDATETEVETIDNNNDAEATGSNRQRSIDDTIDKDRMSSRDELTAYQLAANRNLPAEWVKRQIDSGVTLKDFRGLVLNHVAARAAEVNVNSRTGDRLSGDETFDNPAFLARSIEDALYARMSGKAPAGAAVEIVGRSMLDMGAMLAEANGERVSWSSRKRLADLCFKQRAAGLATTTDFPVLLGNAGNRILADAYSAAQCPLKALAKRRDAFDLKPTTVGRLSEPPELDEILEGGEVKRGSRVESKESFRVKTYAKIFSISRNAIINDDLGAFHDVNAAWGQSAAQKEADLLVALFTANSGNGANLDDGNPLYGTGAGRKNKSSTPALISVSALSEGRQAMREQRGIDGKTFINAIPKHLVVGPQKETEAELVLANIEAATVHDANPFAGKLTLHVEPRFTGPAWRLFADPALAPVIAIAYLDGESGPKVDVQDGWDVLGAEFRAVLDFGCGLVDFRGTYLNTAAES